jgi:hypothetical protein
MSVNRAVKALDAIEGVLVPTFADVEIIVVDDRPLDERRNDDTSFALIVLSR